MSTFENNQSSLSMTHMQPLQPLPIPITTSAISSVPIIDTVIYATYFNRVIHKIKTTIAYVSKSLEFMQIIVTAVEVIETYSFMKGDEKELYAMTCLRKCVHVLLTNFPGDQVCVVKVMVSNDAIIKSIMQTIARASKKEIAINKKKSKLCF